MQRRLAVLPIVVLALVAAACGGSDDTTTVALDEPTSQTTERPTTTESPTTTTEEPECASGVDVRTGVCGDDVEADASSALSFMTDQQLAEALGANNPLSDICEGGLTKFAYVTDYTALANYLTCSGRFVRTALQAQLPMGSLVTEPSSNACGGANQQSWYYCPADDTVYLGADRLASMAAYGPNAAPAALMFAYTGYLQDYVGIWASDHTVALSMDFQSACVAGAYMKWFYTQYGGLGTYSDHNGVYAWIQGYNLPPGDQQALINAFNSGMNAGSPTDCNNYFNVPILTPPR